MCMWYRLSVRCSRLPEFNLVLKVIVSRECCHRGGPSQPRAVWTQFFPRLETSRPGGGGGANRNFFFPGRAKSSKCSVLSISRCLKATFFLMFFPPGGPNFSPGGAKFQFKKNYNGKKWKFSHSSSKYMVFFNLFFSPGGAMAPFGPNVGTPMLKVRISHETTRLWTRLTSTWTWY